ncbi:MAG: DEAD/DEAH box helicase family protein, partial [Deltaproteobacteria bacterium]|nr:DEAD/DEAH box helicase family protein [Deltaproteobacteria bacterium]
MSINSKRSCIFCNVDPARVFHEGELIIGFWDGFPVNPGHALLVPRRHVGDWFAASRDEQQALLDGVAIARDAILKQHSPDGFNIGVNVGQAAGQTVMHLHLHVIPRYDGDIDDPTGGVRLVIPSKGNYRKAQEGVASAWPPGPIQPDLSAKEEGLVVGGEIQPLRPHLLSELVCAAEVDIAVAFVKDSGVQSLLEHLRDFLDRGGRLRLVTGDYLNLTDPPALHKLLDLIGDHQLRVFDCDVAKTGFHPKAYIFHPHDGELGSVAFVGSSNLSGPALGQTVEWNYRVVDAGQEGFKSIVGAFEELFTHPATRPITREWVAEYAKRSRPWSPVANQPPTDIEDEPVVHPPKPHGVQVEALEALQRTREQGNKAGLVVLATGLGKTWLGAFDSHRPEFSRVLFVAHREEILGQALNTFRRIRPDGIFGRYTGKEKVSDADVLFASIQSLGKKWHLLNFEPEAFDYIIIDEFHHAAARTYRQLIEHFEPKFLLGLTATPERSDGGDLMALCGENLVFRLDLLRGIERKLLCPFRYFGVPDVVDYSNIPWRSRHFDERELTEALATKKRAQNALEQYRDRARPGSRTLAFCSSKRHADFMAGYFRDAGLRAVAVH